MGSRLCLKCDGTRTETRFRLSTKRTNLFKSAGASVRSTTGSWGVHVRGSNAGYTMFRGSVKGTGYPLHSSVFPSLALPCVTVCHHISTGIYFLINCKRTSPFKSVRGRQFSRLLRNRGVRISGSNAGYTMFRGSVKGTGYPLHSSVFPSLALPCVTVCHHISTGVYQISCNLTEVTVSAHLDGQQKWYPVRVWSDSFLF